MNDDVHYLGGIADWIETHARWHGERIALVEGERRLSYGEFAARIDRLAGALAERGIGKGDRVAGLLLNSIPFLELTFACARLGAIFVPLNFRLSPAEIGYILADCGARIVVYHAVFAPLLAPALAADPALVTVPVDSVSREDGQPSYDEWMASARSLTEKPRVSQQDVHVMMYTSGTTGHPKGAMLTHGNTTWNAINLMLSENALSTDDVVLTVAPMFHIGGLNIHTLPALYKGIPVVLLPRFEPHETLRTIARERVTALFLVPSMWLMLSQLPDFDAYDLSSLRVLVSGGAPCPIPVIEFFQRRGLRFVEGFGMTETAPNACILDSADAVRKNGSVGKPLMHMQMRIVDDQDRDVTPGEVGELVVRGPNVFVGYWNRPEATAEAFRGGWFHTGDLARQDEEGYFYIVDRKKDMLISGGENVYPTEVEQVLYRHPKVVEVAVVGAPDPLWGEIPVLVVAPKEGEHLTLEEVRAFCEGKLAHFKIPKRIVEVAALPRNAAGKVLKRELRRLVAGETLS